MDLQDVFSTLEDEDDVVYNYEGAKGENGVLVWLEYLMSTFYKNYHNYLKCTRHKMKILIENFSNRDSLIFPGWEFFVQSYLWVRPESVFCVTAL